MAFLRDMRLASAAVHEDVPFVDAVRTFVAARLPAIAVLRSNSEVAGLFTDDDVLRGLFPRYLGELRHTAFLVNDSEPLAPPPDKALKEPVWRYMSEPVSVEIDAGPAHVVERFLHSPWGALAVVERGTFVGMVDQLTVIDRLTHDLDLLS